MSNDQIRLLSNMKKLINEGNRRFQQRSDRDYLEDLLDFGICEEEAWNHILGLNKHFYFLDPKPNYLKDNNSLIFKKKINEKIAYIKIKLEKNNNRDLETVCLSFHIDGKGVIL